MTEHPTRTGFTLAAQGGDLAYRTLGSATDPAVVLVHGGAAHSGWWDLMAPRLALGRLVVLPDLSGHGRSGHCSDYGPEVWATDLAEVLAAVTARPAVLVGHSMGGLVAVSTAARHPELVHGVVLVDTRLPLRGLPRPPRTVRHFPTAQDALARFRLSPPETVADHGVLRALAQANLRETPEGWRWRFDPESRRRFTNDSVRRDLERLVCPVGYAYGARSTVGGVDSLSFLSEVLGRPVPAREVAGAFHHVPVDQPELLAQALEELLDALGNA